MLHTLKNILIPQTILLRIYVAVVLIVNTGCFIWSLGPGATGIYIILFVLLPLNIMLMLAGLIAVIIMQIRKYPANYPVHYITVILLPIAAQIISVILSNTFSPKMGC